MDVNMPVLNGIEATKLHRFAALGQRHVPIIGLTADASPATAERCREAGMDACLTKPVEPARLAEVVEAHGRPSSRGEEGSAGGAAGSARVAPIASHPGFRRAAPPPLDPQVLDSLEALGGSDFVAGVAKTWGAMPRAGLPADRSVRPVPRPGPEARGGRPVVTSASADACSCAH